MCINLLFTSTYKIVHVHECTPFNVTLLQHFDLGVGLFSNDADPLQNNSIVQGTTDFIGSIHCMSSSRDIAIGQWYYPNGLKLDSQSNNGTFIVVYGGGADSSSYVTLQQVNGTVLSPSEEGVYTCEMPDHNGAIQTLHVGIYGSNFFGKYQIGSIYIIIPGVDKLCVVFIAE